MNAPTNTPPMNALNNPLLSFGRGIAQYDQVKPEQIAPAIEYLLNTCEQAVAAAVGPSTLTTWHDLVEPL